jgi:hypothetical protein
VSYPGEAKLGRHSPALSLAVEQELHDHIQFMEKNLYGLTTTDVRRLAFDVAEANGQPHSFNTSNGMAGPDWLRNFFARHNDLSIREPEGTNLSRAVGFNEAKITQFFDVYAQLVQQDTFIPSRIWILDETGISTVQKLTKIVSTKGARQVAKMTSGERGITVTVIYAFSAVGVYLPPMFHLSSQEDVRCVISQLAALLKVAGQTQKCF